MPLPQAPFIGGAKDYKIQRSVRLRGAAGAKLTRTPAVSGNRSKLTVSVWFKRGTMPVATSLLGANTTTAGEAIDIHNNQISFGSYTIGTVVSARWLLDPSSWYHVVVALDTTLPVASQRVRMWLNGEAITAFQGTPTYPAQNSQTERLNVGGMQQVIGQSAVATNQFDGHLADYHFVDGQALPAEAFGYIDSVTGVWMPKGYAGAYGANGFYLDFADNTAATAAALGKDRSGNNNDWTPANISLTPGLSYDSMLDVPTNRVDGGNGRGNYCTLNPIDKSATSSLFDGNLRTHSLPDTWHTAAGTIGVSTGKWYWEVRVAALSSAGQPYVMSGIISAVHGGLSGFYPGNDAASYGYYAQNGGKYHNNTYTIIGPNGGLGTVVGIALDMDIGTMSIFVNGAPLGVAFSGLTGLFLPAVATYGGATATANFGQQPFDYTPPAGFKTLCTANFPEPIIRKPKDYFDIAIATGAGLESAVNSKLLASRDLRWIKNRVATTAVHVLWDTARGETAWLDTTSTMVESAIDYQDLHQTDAHVGWLWQKGSLPGFDIVKYTGTGVARTVPHSLGAPPSMMVIKSRTSEVSWVVYHARLGATQYLVLDTTGAAVTSAGAFNNAQPTSSGFTVGTGTSVNGAGQDCIAYLWAEVPGFSKFGSYIGNGSADGPFVYCGFRPAYILVKNASVGADGYWWAIWDTGRNTINGAGAELYADLGVPESSGNALIDVLSNGFKLRSVGARWNGNGNTQIFAAFAEHPFKYARAR